MNLDIIIKRSILAPEGYKKLTKKQLRKLVLAQVGEIADLTCSLNSLWDMEWDHTVATLAKTTDLKKKNTRFANMDYDTVYDTLKKEVFLPEINYKTGKTNHWKTKKQLRKLMLTQAEEIIDLICKKMDTRIALANVDYPWVISRLLQSKHGDSSSENSDQVFTYYVPATLRSSKKKAENEGGDSSEHDIDPMPDGWSIN
tara:strand:+ start:87 stop:686 length:600 start_codon:yes stop_codon:yes gene_type:complete